MEGVAQDFTAWVKGAGYICAGIAMLGFVGFWIYLTGREGKRR